MSRFSIDGKLRQERLHAGFQQCTAEGVLKECHLKSIFVGLIIVVLCLVSARAHATIVALDDPFDDGNRTDGADPLDTNWYTHNADTTLSIVDDTAGIGNGNALDVNNTNQHDRIVAGFDDISLDPGLGSKVILEFDVRITATGSSATGNETGLRFGLYDDNGTPTTADNQGNAADGDDNGYRMMFSVANGNPRTFLQVEKGTGDAILSGSDRQTLYNSENGPNSASIPDNEPHSVKMVITRVAGGVTIDGFLDGVSVFDAPAFDDDDNLSPYAQSGDLVLPVIESFNEVAFGDSTTSGSFSDFILDNVRVYAVPEPSMVLLASLGTVIFLGAPGLWRRRGLET